MAKMNLDQQKALREDLIGRSFRGAKWKLRLLEPNPRLRYHRTNREVGKWTTRYDLPESGVFVTLVETNDSTAHKNGTVTSDFTYVDAIVEPLPDVETDPSRTGYVTSRPG